MSEIEELQKRLTLLEASVRKLQPHSFQYEMQQMQNNSLAGAYDGGMLMSGAPCSICGRSQDASVHRYLQMAYSLQNWT